MSSDAFIIGGGTGAAPKAAGEAVPDITTAQFMTEVIEESRKRPVLVDFWAPWCGPCKQLAPVLEKVVAAMRGAVRLVKMNIDNHPEIAGRMGIQSIPAVVAFVDGQPRDAFMGVQSEAEIKRFLDRLGAEPAGPDLDEWLAQADAFAAQGADGDAANLYAAVLEQEPENVRAFAGMGSLYLKEGDLERSQALYDAIRADKQGDPAAKAFKAALDLAVQAASVGDLAPLFARIEANPKDHEARFDLAVALNAAGKREDAADHLLEIVRRDRTWREDGAKAQLLQFFEAWGPTDPETLSARRRLSSLLFS